MLAPTAAGRGGARRRAGSRNVGVWGRGVDSERFGPERRDEELRARLLGADGGVLLLSVGRLSHEKRIDVLLDAYARRRRASGRTCGSSSSATGRRGASWSGRRRAEPSSPASSSASELAALYASADVFCFPSTTDTFGQVLLEAGASGLPVVAAAAGGALELVQRRPHRPARPARRAARCSRRRCSSSRTSPALRRRLGAAGRAAALAPHVAGRDRALSQAVYRGVLGIEREESLVAA